MALSHPAWTVDTTFSGKDISSAASVYTFTAAADGKVQFTVKLTNAAGNGDYIVYLKRQWLGAGTASVVLPKTTCAAASGETVIEFVSMELSVKDTDVVDVMIDGLAGDTSVSGAIRISADNPSVFDADNDTASANVTLWQSDPVNDAIDGYVPVSGQDIADALLLAPSGPAASGSTMDYLADISAASAAGSGAISFPVTINDEDSNPIDGVEVWVTTDSAGTNVVAGTLSTDAMGLATFMLDAGTYYVWRQKSGYNFTNPVSITVS